ncbi:MAG: hypothetical protein JJT76_12860 [Clostridiaceae bacterium]|nr:hypothetical protein [Clostridiaceae bacterium]
MIQEHYGLTDEEIHGMPDEDFYELAGRMLFLQERKIQVIKAGIMNAVAAMFKKS